MAQGYERKDNRLKTCVLRVIGPRIIMWRIYSWLLSFCLIFLFLVLPFQLGFFLSLCCLLCFYFCLLLFFLLVLFLYLHISTSSRVSSVIFFWAPKFDLFMIFGRTFLVFAFCVEGDPWSGLWKKLSSSKGDN